MPASPADRQFASIRYLYHSYTLDDLATLTGIPESRWLLILADHLVTTRAELRTIVLAAHRDHANEQAHATPDPRTCSHNRNLASRSSKAARFPNA